MLPLKKKQISIFLIAIFLMGSGSKASSQELDVHFVATPQAVVEAMLNVAAVGEGDYVIDLGAGDGRIVIAAAKRGAFGHGVELDPKMVEIANIRAKEEGVSEKVFFLEENIFDTDISKASVITMYLLGKINRQMKPIILQTLKPGTRIVSHDFAMGDWEPDIEFVMEVEDDETTDISLVFFWIVPANFSGEWEWAANNNNFKMTVEQKFQKIKVRMFANDRELDVETARVSGKTVAIKAHDKSKMTYFFKGQIDENALIGEVIVSRRKNSFNENWKAKRKGDTMPIYY